MARRVCSADRHPDEHDAAASASLNSTSTPSAGAASASTGASTTGAGSLHHRHRAETVRTRGGTWSTSTFPLLGSVGAPPHPHARPRPRLLPATLRGCGHRHGFYCSPTLPACWCVTGACFPNHGHGREDTTVCGGGGLALPSRVPGTIPGRSPDPQETTSCLITCARWFADQIWMASRIESLRRLPSCDREELQSGPLVPSAAWCAHSAAPARARTRTGGRPLRALNARVRARWWRGGGQRAPCAWLLQPTAHGDRAMARGAKRRAHTTLAAVGPP